MCANAPLSEALSLGWLIDWLVDWSVGRLVGWSVGWLVGQLVSRLVGRSVGWLVGWLVRAVQKRTKRKFNFHYCPCCHVYDLVYFTCGTLPSLFFHSFFWKCQRFYN